MSQESTYYVLINGQRIDSASLPELRKLIKDYVKQNNLSYSAVGQLFCEKNGKIIKTFDR